MGFDITSLGKEFDPSVLSALEIPTQKRGGYDIDYVDDLLDVLNKHMYEMNEELNSLKAKNNLARGISAVEGKIVGTDDGAALPALVEDETVEEFDGDEIRELEEENARLVEEIESLRASLASNSAFEVNPDHLSEVEKSTGILAHAVRISEETRVKAENEARHLLDKASHEASALVSKTELDIEEQKRELAMLRERRASFLFDLKRELTIMTEEVDDFLGNGLSEGVTAITEED